MIDSVAIQLGPISIRWYAVFIVLGLLPAVYLAIKEAPRRKIIPDNTLDFILIAFPLAITGARAYYVTLDRPHYANQPLNEIVAIWNGGLAIYDGLIIGAIALFVFSYYQAINPLDLLDIAAPGVMVAQATGRWGNFTDREAYGRTVDNLNYLSSFIKNQTYINGLYRVPTFLYELLWDLSGSATVMSLRHRPRFFKRSEIAFFYLIWYGCGCLVIEGMRIDSLMLLGIRVSQRLSALLVLIGVVSVIWGGKQKDVPYYQEQKVGRWGKKCSE